MCVDEVCNQSCQLGSIIGCENQTLGEVVPVNGTPFSLHYQSDRTTGYLNNRSLDIPLSSASLPEFIKRIDLSIMVAGREFSQSFDPAPSLNYKFTWDGIDAYGRTAGSSQATVKISYIYDGYYNRPLTLARTFGLTGTVFEALVPARQDVALKQEYSVVLGIPKNVGLGGWSLNIHHTYDPNGKVLYLADRTRRSVQSIASGVINTVAGNGVRTSNHGSGNGGPAILANFWAPYDIAVGPDGSIYISDPSLDEIRRVGPDGIITAFAGKGVRGFNGDGGLAINANLNGPSRLAISPDGSLYFSDSGNYRIGRVGTDGIITTVAGTGVAGFSGDGGLAINANLNGFYGSTGLAISPDGSLYFTDFFNNRIRRVGTDGIIMTVAGTGVGGYSGDGGQAIRANIRYPGPITIGPDGSLYFFDSGNYRIRRITANGIITTIAGTGNIAMGEYANDGVLATNTKLPSLIGGLAIDPDGNLYIAVGENLCCFYGNDYRRIWQVGIDGLIRTVAGSDGYGFIDGGQALQGTLDPRGIAIGPNGILYIADS